MAEKRGAKSKCTPELIQEAYKYSALGLLDKDIQVLLDISNDSFYRYIKESSDFSDAIKKGRVKGKAERIERILKAAKAGNWNADAWFLERKYPEEFAKKENIRLNHGGEIAIGLTGITDEQLRDIASRGGGGTGQTTPD